MRRNEKPSIHEKGNCSASSCSLGPPLPPLAEAEAKGGQQPEEREGFGRLGGAFSASAGESTYLAGGEGGIVDADVIEDTREILATNGRLPAHFRIPTCSVQAAGG